MLTLFYVIWDQPIADLTLTYNSNSYNWLLKRIKSRVIGYLIWAYLLRKIRCKHYLNYNNLWKNNLIVLALQRDSLDYKIVFRELDEAFKNRIFNQLIT